MGKDREEKEREEGEKRKEEKEPAEIDGPGAETLAVQARELEPVLSAGCGRSAWSRLGGRETQSLRKLAVDTSFTWDSETLPQRIVKTG